MRFSELSLVSDGYVFDGEALRLTGERNGFGVSVSDDGGEYIIRIYADSPYKYEKFITDSVLALSEKLPKNSVNAQICELCFAEVRLCRGLFLQENLPIMLDFIDALTAVLSEKGLNGAPAAPPEKARPREEAKPRKAAAGFSINSLKGLLGALIGAAAMTFISSALIRLGDTGGTLFSDIGSYVLSAAAALLIFFDYKFLAKRLDAFGVIACPVISVLYAAVSALLITARAYAAACGLSVSEALGSLTRVFDAAPELAVSGAGYLLISVIISGAVSVICCKRYFDSHPEETLSEKR